MSRGNRIVPVRFNPDEMAKLVGELARYNGNPLNSAVSMSGFIRRAVVEKIDHAERSRSRRRPNSDELTRFIKEEHGIQIRIADGFGPKELDHG